jgi:hypothetical protein
MLTHLLLNNTQNQHQFIKITTFGRNNTMLARLSCVVFSIFFFVNKLFDSFASIDTIKILPLPSNKRNILLRNTKSWKAEEL